MHNPQIFRLAEVIHQERLAEAAQRRQYAVFATRAHWHDHVLMALGARLIRWGQQLQGPPQPVETHT